MSYTEYDQATGAVTKSIRDVDISAIPSGSLEASTLPSGWTTPTGGGLNLVSTYANDTLGRTTRVTDPNGNSTFMVYDEANHETRMYQGWTYDSGTSKYVQMSSPPPTQVTRDDLAGNYYETLTMSATPNVDATTGTPLGTEAISSVQSLTRSLMNDAGQVVETDTYYDVTTNHSSGGSTFAYSTTAQIGTAWNHTSPSTAANYYATIYQYSHRGQLEKTVNPNGTIYRTVFDALERATSTWVGTDDTPTTGYFSPANLSGTNMVELTRRGLRQWGRR